MDAIVICGGKGTRVRSITNDEIPKIMIPVNGQPFVDYLIDILYEQGVRKITFAAGFLGGHLKVYVENRYPCLCNVAIEREPLDTAGGVLNALSRGNVEGDPFLVVNGDCLVLPGGEDNYEELYYDLLGKPACAMFTCFTEHDGRYGSLEMINKWVSKNIIGFKNGVPGESWINCGWYIMRNEIFRDREVRKLSMERDVFPDYLESGQFIAPIEIGREQFLEIGTPEALEEAAEKLKEI